MAAYCSTALHALYRPIRVAYLGHTEDRAAYWEYAKAHWKKIGAAALCGILAGFLAGVESSGARSSLNTVVYAAAPTAAPATARLLAVAAVPGSGAAAELSRLRAENQALQAQLESLRKRPAPVHARAKAHHRTLRARPSPEFHPVPLNY